MKKGKKEGKKIAALLIRISPELKARLAELAKREHRSLNQQIEFMLIEALRREIGDQK
jgi:hypothetical protein